MRKVVFFLLSLSIIVTSTGFAHATEDELRMNRRKYAHVPKLSAYRAYYLFAAGKLVLIDANSSSRFREEHAFGAINLPASKIQNTRLRLKKATQIGVY